MLYKSLNTFIPSTNVRCMSALCQRPSQSPRLALGKACALTPTDAGHGGCSGYLVFVICLTQRQPHLTRQSSLGRHSVLMSPNARGHMPPPWNDSPEEPRRSVRREDILPEQAGGGGTSGSAAHSYSLHRTTRYWALACAGALNPVLQTSLPCPALGWAGHKTRCA